MAGDAIGFAGRPARRGADELQRNQRCEMGRGDKRSRKGKIYRGSYGKTRPGKIKKKERKTAKRGS